MKLYVDDGDDANNVDLYDKLDPSLKPFLKKVTVTCNDGDNYTATHEFTAHMFLASHKEVGFRNNLFGTYGPVYNAEGTCFDLFTTDNSSRAAFASTANMSSVWWLRTADHSYSSFFYEISPNGSCGSVYPSYTFVVVPVFVIG
jgi:hypothetical protein